MTNASGDDRASEREPANTELEEPSTEKDPDEEPQAAQPADSEPSHQAVGIGVIGGPLVDPDPDSPEE
jgi:hypothetical protein